MLRDVGSEVEPPIVEGTLVTTKSKSGTSDSSSDFLEVTKVRSGVPRRLLDRPTERSFVVTLTLHRVGNSRRAGDGSVPDLPSKS